MADFSRPYVKRVKKPLFSALGPGPAKSLLFECFLELKLSPFSLNASGYHRLVSMLAKRLEQKKLVDARGLERLKKRWSVDSIRESEIMGPVSRASRAKIVLPKDAESMCHVVTDAVISGSSVRFQVPKNPTDAQKSVSDAMHLLFGSISSMREMAEQPEASQAGMLLASQLERYERITAFSRQINTVDLERLREKISLLPDVLAVEEVAVLVYEGNGGYDPFYISTDYIREDLSVGLLLASLAEEAAKRRIMVSGFEQEFADTYRDAVAAADLSPYWLSVPLLIEDNFLGAVIVFDDSSNLYTEDETNVIARVCNHIASALQNCIQYKNVRHLQQRLDEELCGVGLVQQSLLPQELPRLPGCEVSAYYRPSGRASGDYYDVVNISENILSFIVADVSGHGAPAAVVMAMSKTAFRLFLKQHMAVSQILSQFNDFLCATLSPDRFVTALVGRIDVVSGVLEYISAGHCPAIVFRGATGEFEFLSQRGMIMGVMPNQEFHSSIGSVAKGDKLIVYTDGITEAKNPAGETFGLTRLLEAIKEAPTSSANDLTEVMVARVDEFIGSEPRDDDITLLTFSF